MVLEANTPAGKIYNLVIFGAILISVVVLLFEPNPLGNSALQQTEVLWIDLVQDSCLAVFAGDFVLHLAVVPSPRKHLFSFTGLIDSVLCCSSLCRRRAANCCCGFSSLAAF